jgi:hypothetical protein
VDGRGLFRRFHQSEDGPVGRLAPACVSAAEGEFQSCGNQRN